MTSKHSVVVTGGTGFVGARLVRALVTDGYSVHVVGRDGSDRTRLGTLAECITHHPVDLSVARERATLPGLFVAIAPRALFHLAGAPLVGGVGSDAATAVQVNVFGTHAVAEAAAAVPGCAIVTIGDAFEYNDLRRPLREEDALTAQPMSMHGITRLAATRAVARLAEQTRAPVATVRLFSVFGPDDDPRRLVPKLIAAAQSGASMPLSNQSVVRDWVYIDDVVDLVRRAARQARVAATAAERVFNAGSGIATTLGELVAMVEALSGAPIDAQWGAFAPTEHDHGYWVGDPTHSASTLGWSARVSLADGLERMLGGLSAS